MSHGLSFAARAIRCVAGPVPAYSSGGGRFRHRGAGRAASVCGERFPKSIKESICYSDFFWEAYQKVIPQDQHEATGKEEGETCHVELHTGYQHGGRRL